MTVTKKTLISEIMGNTPKSVANHLKEERLYLDLFSYFTEEELSEFKEKRTIKKLDLLSSLSLEDIQSLLEDKNAQNASDEYLLSTALFKVEVGLESSLLHPIFKNSLRKAKNSNEIKESVLQAIEESKGGIFTHTNHKNIVSEFVDNFLTEDELRILSKHYTIEVN